jgi:hypothetical protein
MEKTLFQVPRRHLTTWHHNHWIISNVGIVNEPFIEKVKEAVIGK